MIVNVHNQEFSCPAEFGGLRNVLIPLYAIRRKIVVNISDDIANEIKKTDKMIGGSRPVFDFSHSIWDMVSVFLQINSYAVELRWYQLNFET